jgi:tetratricopeptide (TPR) repeat protein
MCELLMHNFDLISHNNKKIYLTCYAKVLIDIGNIKESHTGESYALQILDKLISCSDNDNELLLTYLLKMSAHEHVLEFQEIKELYKKSNKIIENNPHLDHISLSKFYRNKGLVAFHTELENDYLKAYEYAQKIKDYSMRNIMEGTCHNNIGLMYFYKGDLTQALNHFNSAYNSLNCVGYDMLRVVNNIATCYFMLGDFENSYKYIAIAKSHPLKGIFEELCIDVNLALNLYKCGQKTEAKRRLDCIINEYNSQNTRTDTAVYSAAMVNRGYIYLVEEDYINAYKMFKSSTCHTYKNKNDIEQRKREELCMICLHKEGILTDAIKNHIDLNEQTNIIFERPYSLMLLAFYII